ncbi:metallophosphoesterase [Clostridiales bacterium COT073_COT-073]|nr:metallophosphoesterase [Clostridiales bacterium COT073_COT-073]
MKSSRKKKWILGGVGIGALLGLAILAFDIRLKTVYYEVKSNKIEQEITIGLIADLHSCDYGPNQITLTDAIEQTKPDFLLLAGDIIDDDMPEQKAIEFLDWAGKNYPSYYVTGNHEYWTKQIERMRQIVRQAGVTVLEGETLALDINGQTIDLSGINDTEEKWWPKELEQAAASRHNDVFSILLSHRPEQIENYLPHQYDLITVGHAHGGQWRIPGLLNGLLAPNQGLFPRYAGGRYDFEKSVMIVSRGLARESTRIPRIFNRPEYVVIRVLPE